MGPKKKASGAQCRKMKKQKEIQTEKMKQNFDKWLVNSEQIDTTSSKSEPPENCKKSESPELNITGSSASATGEDTREADEEDQMSTKRGVSCESCSEYSENNDAAPTGFMASTSIETDEQLQIPISSQVTVKLGIASDNVREIDGNDPESWVPITDAVRCALVERGPEQEMEANFSLSSSADDGHFSKDWFYKRMPNGETVNRKWLIYSEVKGACFCFPCILFAKQRTITTGKLTNVALGYTNWKHLNDTIPQHENSPDHRKCCLAWKDLEHRL